MIDLILRIFRLCLYNFNMYRVTKEPSFLDRREKERKRHQGDCVPLIIMDRTQSNMIRSQNSSPGKDWLLDALSLLRLFITGLVMTGLFSYYQTH